MSDNPPIRIYVNQTEYRIENVPHLEITETVLVHSSIVVHCDIVNNDYSEDSKVLYTSVPNKLFGQLIDTPPKKFIFLKTLDTEFSHIEVWFTNQNSKLLKIEDKINITLVIN